METQKESDAREPVRRHVHGAARIALITVGFFAVAALFVFVGGVVIKALWNALMPGIFHLRMISYWEAVGLFVLAKLFFGLGHGGRGRGRHHHPHKHFDRHFRKAVGISDEGCGRGDVPGNGRTWHRFRHFWEDEGRAAFEAYLKKRDSETGGGTGPM